ncbi:MAG TPA: heme o synthase [Solirubrobacteraceae bacterium]|nr:heme o synthase [Solirubrobacteraceae bacterium]
MTITESVAEPVRLPAPSSASAPLAGADAAAPAAWRDYVTLTKPRIMSLLVLTAVCAMVAAAGGHPDVLALLALTVGGGLACGASGTLNHVLDRDIDRVMGPRTANRPVAARRISPRRAVLFGALLAVLSFLIMSVFTNLLAAVLALAGGIYYVLVYTVWLKRNTSQNIVIGGAAGAMPALSGWAAAHGQLGLGAWLLFTIVLVWTPPHFWALALLLKRQYKAADVPMLPVVKGSRATVRQVLLYTVLLLGVSLIPVATGTFGLLYAGAAVILGGVFLWLAGRLWRRGTAAAAGVVFHYSLLYLALLFVAVAVDATVR